MIRISVVVPTCQRVDLLERCLEALACQSLAPALYEVIVVDDGPSDAEATVERLFRNSGMACRALQTKGREGPATARNRGWQAARGRIVAFTDDDTIPDKHWLKAGLAAFQTDVIAATGRVIVPIPEVPTDYQRNESNLERAEFVTANCFVLRSVLESLGGFDERFRLAWREDSDLHFRLLDEADRSGRRLVKAEDAVVVHPIREARWGVSLFQQRKGIYNALLYRLHPQRYRERIQSTPPWHYYMIVFSIGAGLLPIWSNEWLRMALLGLGGVVMGHFCGKRLQGTSRQPSHVVEMLLTSALIPFFAIFYRWWGALRFRRETVRD